MITSGPLPASPNKPTRFQGEPIPEADLKPWLAQALLALHALQAHQVVHRDITPEHLSLSDANEALLGEFGLAARRKGEDGEDHSVVGTPAYMAPEVISGDHYGFPADVWCVF